MKNTAPKKSSKPEVAPKTKSIVKRPAKETKQMTMLSKQSSVINPERRNKMIAEAAYYLAEKSGFNPNLSIKFWLEAEKQIDNKILDS
jgi:hypothetical protein